MCALLHFKFPCIQGGDPEATKSWKNHEITEKYWKMIVEMTTTMMCVNIDFFTVNHDHIQTLQIFLSELLTAICEH